ncbi:HAMP domain-containing sensor histidine kinase [Nocardiopsis sp. NPDC006198]|uniref:histidine kinase n=1 Tax=Streptomonospora nanhaiensis TaxID=1323731 RepID=A0ABY6YQ37_9ACTN|nr:HAMP domain-containing sensor histidine kinase [Streptomonospora nanhaiensis]WAE74317.1 HAMP domain-containing sensor histidine kinase [Streptomonospora nanhaiensis]
MRRRVLTVYATLLVAACLGLALPLCGSIAARGTSDMLLDRINDTARFAGLAEPGVLTGAASGLTGELAAYDRLYGITAVVVDRDGAVVASSREVADLSDLEPGRWGQHGDELPEAVRTALAGNRMGADRVVYPWQRGPLVVAEPVGRSGEVVGAAVTASPTGSLRRSTLVQWCVAWAAVAVLMAAGFAAAGPLTRWVLRPIDDLEEATRAVSGGSLDTRVRAEEGPEELRRLGESFNRMADTITSMLESQRTFVSYAGHQVRNPLAALRLRVDSLSRHLTPEGARDHRMALDEVDRLSRICDSLLTLARTEDTEQSLVWEDVLEVVDDRLASWEPIAERAGAVLVREGVEGVRVRSAEGTLDQALDALIDNALKFGGSGVRVTVRVERAEAGPDGPGHVDVHVVDDGPGLPEARLEQASRPFWRDGHDGVGGSGLGLSIVVTLLELQGAHLSLRPASPHGIDARIRLPA